jgi:hypothetical protein
MTLGYFSKFVHYSSTVFFRILFLFKKYVGLNHEVFFSDCLAHSPFRQRPTRKRNQHKLTSGKEGERGLGVKRFCQVH